MKTITLDVSEKVESTSAPWWTIIDPRQNFRVDNQSIHDIASMVTGPFFSREEATDHLNSRRYAFSKNAQVFCHSGYYSQQYRNAYEKKESQDDTK